MEHIGNYELIFPLTNKEGKIIGKWGEKLKKDQKIEFSESLKY